MGRPRSGIDKRKQSLYFPNEMMKEIESESERLDRSLSWMMQRAWLIARDSIKAYPSIKVLHVSTDSARVDAVENDPMLKNATAASVEAPVAVSEEAKKEG